MPEFEQGLLGATNGGVDKDTTGAIAGALLGAYWGESHIPEKWRSRVEKRDVILGLADEIILAGETSVIDYDAK
jgi:ADP-ribosyl-[dinitrogen reductase] hydrolase